MSHPVSYSCHTSLCPQLWKQVVPQQHDQPLSFQWYFLHYERGKNCTGKAEGTVRCTTWPMVILGVNGIHLFQHWTELEQKILSTTDTPVRWQLSWHACPFLPPSPEATPNEPLQRNIPTVCAAHCQNTKWCVSGENAGLKLLNWKLLSALLCPVKQLLHSTLYWDAFSYDNCALGCKILYRKMLQPVASKLSFTSKKLQYQSHLLPSPRAKLSARGFWRLRADVMKSGLKCSR